MSARWRQKERRKESLGWRRKGTNGTTERKAAGREEKGLSEHRVGGGGCLKAAREEKERERRCGPRRKESLQSLIRTLVCQPGHVTRQPRPYCEEREF
jgi:hypothetical protein